MVINRKIFCKNLKFQENTIWYIAPYEKNTFEFPNINGNIVQEIHYIQKIKRKSTYYVWVLIAPTFIITALSLAGLHSPFNNQGDREDKVQFTVVSLLPDTSLLY
jgi:hypothetical protein